MLLPDVTSVPLARTAAQRACGHRSGVEGPGATHRDQAQGPGDRFCVLFHVSRSSPPPRKDVDPETKRSLQKPIFGLKAAHYSPPSAGSGMSSPHIGSSPKRCSFVVMDEGLRQQVVLKGRTCPMKQSRTRVAWMARHRSTPRSRTTAPRANGPGQKCNRYRACDRRHGHPLQWRGRPFLPGRQ